MAEINVSAGNNRHDGSVHKRKKLSTQVDLTPMVDLGFLLITFFMVTTTWSAAKAMTFYTPADGPAMLSGETGTLSVIAGDNNRIFYYHGKLDEALAKGAYGFTSYHVLQGLGNIIRNKQMQMDLVKKGYRKDLMVVIHPTAKASYQNIVAILDEMLINDVPHYAMVDPGEDEKTLLSKYKIEL